MSENGRENGSLEAGSDEDFLDIVLKPVFHFEPAFVDIPMG